MLIGIVHKKKSLKKDDGAFYIGFIFIYFVICYTLVREIKYNLFNLVLDSLILIFLFYTINKKNVSVENISEILYFKS